MNRRLTETLLIRLMRQALPCMFALLLASAMRHAAAAAEFPTHRSRINGVRAASDARPSVVFASGLGDTLDVWRDVQSAIAAHCTRTLAYNRAGYPGSAPPHGARDARTIVAELRAELRRQDMAPPYVLVGHSIGGLYMQYFARTYPEEVAGLLLVDSTHWDQRLLMGMPAQDSYTNRGTFMLFMSFIARRELEDSARAGEQVHSSPPARGVPTIVLSSTAAFLGETPATRAMAARLQDEIVADFPGARHVRVNGSGHYIQRDRPDVVVRAARELAKCERRSG
ncbi:MAG TPA: alpha/beta fold hydrolase [Steroidobacter sp.]|jgi:pimeloyl-ACP methyl ester carboxylesterase|nr:alpha/beta fold hydrolase [Steroidobacteraceae bacterium]HLS82361.1 alpha/beta fold hydrolase [Steroidobacter sp.]